MIKCDGPECPNETMVDDWKARLDWIEAFIQLTLPGRPDGDEETTANAARSTISLNFCSDECWQNWRRNGPPIDWPVWEKPTIRIRTQRSAGSLAPLKGRAAGSQLLAINRESTLSPGEIPKGKIVNPEGE